MANLEKAAFDAQRVLVQTSKPAKRECTCEHEQNCVVCVIPAGAD